MSTQRSEEKEILDLGQSYYTHQEYVQCHKKMFTVNKLFGFFHGTIKILKTFPKASSLLDVGCGDGLFLLHLSKHLPHMQLLGMDISPEGIDEAQQSLQRWQKTNPNIGVSFRLQQQYALDLPTNSFDVVLLTLVCHHLSDNELVIFLARAHLAARKAVIINELHRHRLARWLFVIVSPLLFQNRLITHDGAISIKRGFTRAEWRLLLQKAGIHNYQLKWCFPFRWKLILWK